MKKIEYLKKSRPRNSLFLLIMKLNLILLTAIFSSGVLHAGELFGQDVVIHLKAATLEKVFDEIEKQTGYAFFYEGNIPSSTFDADFEDVELGKVLIDILKPFRLSYYQRERQIVIIEDNSPPAAQTTSQAGRQQPQEKTVTGSVKDSSGEPLVGAIVLLKGTQTSALTGEGGRFSLNNIPDDGILVFSFFGYETLETPVDSRSELDVILTENIQVLEQVVAVGYGTQKKENLTGSVEVINSRSLVDRPAMNTSQLLQGNVSGVNFSYSSFGAEPGAPLELSIRGTLM